MTDFKKPQDKAKSSWKSGGGRGKFFAKPSNGGGGGQIPKGDAILLQGNSDHWRHYLGVQEYKDVTTKLKIQAAKRFLSQHKIRMNQQNNHFLLDYKTLLTDQELKTSWPDIGKELETKCNKVMGIFGLAAEEKQVVKARLTGLKHATPLKDLKSQDVGRTVMVKGSVIRVENISQMCTWLTFKCENCDALCGVEQRSKGRFVRPNKCPSDGCRSQTFTANRSNPSTITVNRQFIRLQESEGSHQGGGRVPRSMDCLLTRELCDSVNVGDVVSLTAIVKVSTETDQLFNLYLEAVSVKNGSHGGGDKTQMEFSLLDYAMVNETFSLGPEIFKLLVTSLCPSIYGHELVKAGLVLALFGGTSKFANDSTRVPIRGDPHVLVVGDPGLGKSQMLLSVQQRAPKSVYVTATGTTTTGLTVTISKGPGNEFSMEAGALVLADQGCCCIDEFDKMSSQHPALLEAMEQQSISLAKSGVSCSVPARTAIIAAANPVGGHYSKAKTVSENLKMHPALLSRFDLVFVLVDNPNEEKDMRLSDHIMTLHSRSSSSGYSASKGSASSSALDTSSSSYISLVNKLSVNPGEEVDIMDLNNFRKYIAYARRYVKPELSSEAAEEIQKFYIELRRKHHQSDATPITTRQLESLIRLTQARAKLELRSESTRQDAIEVIEIMKHSMIDVYSDELGEMDFSRSLHGSGVSKGKAKKAFLQDLQKRARGNGNNLFNVDDLKVVAQAAGLSSDKFSETLSQLNDQGHLLKKSPQLYQLLNC